MMSEVESSERRLIEHLKQGSQTAWDELIILYREQLVKDIRASLNKRGLPADYASDVEQQTWLAALECVLKEDELEYSGEGQLYHWLRSIALMRIFNLTKHQPPAGVAFDEPEHEVLLDHVMYRLGLYEHSPEDGQIEEDTLREYAAVVRQAVQGLSARKQEIIIRYYLLGEDPRTIAAACGIELNSLLHDLRRTMRNLETYALAKRLFKTSQPIDRRAQAGR